MNRFSQLFATVAGSAMARQMAFADFLGDRNWSVTLDEGQVHFGDDLVYPLQLIGTEAQHNDTWLWAWANPSAIPLPLLEAAEQLRQYGEQHHLPELTERSCGLDVADGHRLSMVASGLVRKTCYYRGPYEGGSLFFLVLGLPIELFARVTAERACTVISQLIETFEVDHRLLAESFLQDQGFALSAVGDGLHAVRDDGSALDLAFDAAQRITEIEATAS
jgi:hypothetical protein